MKRVVVVGRCWLAGWKQASKTVSVITALQETEDILSFTMVETDTWKGVELFVMGQTNALGRNKVSRPLSYFGRSM